MTDLSMADSTQGARLGELIVQAIERHPQRIAFIDGAGSTTSEALGLRIAQAISTLRTLGLQPGDSVALLSGNSTDMFCILSASYIGGFCSVTLHAMAGLDDHAAILEDCKARVVVSGQAYAERIAQLRQRCGASATWLSHDAQDSLPSFWDVAADGDTQLRVQGEGESIIRLAYTGGTTGLPKGVMLSNRAMLANARLWLAGLDWPDGVRTLCSAPISHGAGSLIFPTLARGGTVVLQRGFTPHGWLEAVAQHRIAFTFIVPTMVYALLDDPATRAADLSSLRALIYGAAPMAPPRIRQALDLFGPVLVQTYGQTEAPNTILLLDQQAHARATDEQLAAAGKPFPGLDVALLDAQDQPVAPGETGEICVRGALVMSGYRGQPEQTAATLRNGWLHTGDLARAGEDGAFYIVDRIKDMIITGGFNVYPKEVEDVLAGHPDVAAVAVIGVPHARWGEAVKAVVVRRAGTLPDAQELIDYVRSRKGAICAPKSVEFVDAVPLTGLGKADKKALRRQFQADAQAQDKTPTEQGIA